jgi:hypothetical protein
LFLIDTYFESPLKKPFKMLFQKFPNAFHYAHLSGQQKPSRFREGTFSKESLKVLLVLLHAVHHGTNLSFRRLASHLEEHRPDHLLIDRRVLGHLAFDEAPERRRSRRLDQQSNKNEIEEQTAKPR